MDSKLIDRFARESGLAYFPGWFHTGLAKKHLERFTALVEQHVMYKERRTLAMRGDEWLKGLFGKDAR